MRSAAKHVFKLACGNLTHMLARPAKAPAKQNTAGLRWGVAVDQLHLAGELPALVEDLTGSHTAPFWYVHGSKFSKCSHVSHASPLDAERLNQSKAVLFQLACERVLDTSNTSRVMTQGSLIELSFVGIHVSYPSRKA